MRLRPSCWLPLAFGALLLSAPIHAQDLPEFEIGLKPFGTYHGGAIDNVSITNGNLTIDSPLFSYPQRGGKLKKSLDLIYNNKGWKFITTCNHFTGECTTRAQWQGSGIRIMDPEDVPGHIITCSVISGGTVWLSSATTDLGAVHVLGDTGLGFWEAIDGSGLRSDSNGLFRRNGARYGVSATVAREDPNGNQITVSADGTTTTDTTGRQFSLPAISDTVGCPAGPRTVTSASVIGVPGPGGTTSQIKYCNVSVNLATAFGFVDTQYNGSATMIQSVLLYNGSSWSTSQAWSFEYGPLTGINYGDLTKITFPTGGSISYTWTMVVRGTSESRGVASRTVNANDGTGPHTWTYTPDVAALPGTNTVTDPLGNDTVYTVTYVGNGQSLYVTQAKYYQGSKTTGTVLKTETTDYTYTSIVNLDCSGAQTAIFKVFPIRVTTTWPGGKVSKVETDYDTNSFTFKNPNIINTETYPGSFGQVLAVRRYDYGTNAPGPLVSQTINTYMSASNPAYKTYNFLDLLSSVTVKDGAGAQKAFTFYGYEESALQSSGITTQHNASPPNGNTRGNLTSVHRWLNGSTVSTTNCPVSVSNGYLVSSSTYYDTGTVSQSTDACLHAISFLYSPAYAGAYPTTITNALSQSVTNVYDFNTGLLTATTDPNNQTTSHTYDSLFRLTQTSFPDGGSTTFSYQDATMPFSVTVTKKITPGLDLVAKAIVDGVGRVSQAQLLSDPEGNDYIDTTYDAAGRRATVSNPYRTTIEPTYGITTSQYDALSRATKVIPPDGSSSANNVVTVYSDNCTTVTDQAGKIRKSCADALGRLTQVFEPNSSNSLVNETDYQYDALGNLIRVDQKGNTIDSTKWRTRTFIYSSLSQLTSSSNPEAGTITYAYDADGNMVTKTDARSITITYAYEKLHRLTGKTYSNADPAVSYAYDEPSCLGQLACYNIGRRTSMTDAAGSQAWAYDKMGRPLTDQRTTNSVTKSTLYTYNLDGSVATLTYPSGRTITYTPNATGRAVSAVDVANSINYATAASYAPTGALASLTNGASVVSTFFYNNRLQPCRISVRSADVSPANCADAVNVGDVLDFTYNFSLGTADNGNVMGITNNRDTTRSQAFTYDTLNRLATAQTASTYTTSPAHCWGEAFGYDTWANLQTISASSSAYTGCTQENLSVTATTKNQISGNTYDASGNTTADGLNTYAWNAESQIKSAAAVNYTYDGDGNRVQKSNGKIYWYGAGTEILDETDLAGNLTNEYVFFGGKRIARRDSAGNIYYYMEDFLGSSRVITTATGTVCYDADFYPYGGERAYTNTCPQNYKFEGKERDTETGNDDFGARSYSSSLGRWLSADWSAVPAPVPYANLTNPQTLNLYAMVSDNPETFADLDGHDEVVRAGPNDANGFGGTGDVSDLQPDTVLQRQQQQQQQSAQPQSQAQNQPTSGEGSQANLDRRAAIAATAKAYADRGDTSMPYTPRCPTCNLFVQRDIAESGAPKPLVTKADGTKAAPGAAEWAKSPVPGWRFFKPGEKPKPGDVAAYALPGHTDYTGHSGIVVSVSKRGVVTAVAAHPTKIGIDMSFQPGVATYRRYTGE